MSISYLKPICAVFFWGAQKQLKAVQCVVQLEAVGKQIVVRIKS